jgi:hypothetical protein
MSEDMRKMIDKVENFKQSVNENINDEYLGKDMEYATYKHKKPNTPNAMLSLFDGAGTDSFIIKVGESFISGLIKGADFPADENTPKSPPSNDRGEVLWINIVNKRSGLGTSLMLDALNLMKLNGVKTVKFTSPSSEGSPFNDYLESKGYIKKIRTANTKSKTTEYEIL